MVMDDQITTSVDELAEYLPGIVFRLIVKATGVLVLDFVCKEAQNILGLDLAEIKQDPLRLSEFIIPEERSMIDQLIRDIRTAKHKIDRVIVVRLKDGSKKHLQIEAVPKKLPDNAGHEWFGVALDITGCKTVENELRQKKRELDDKISEIERKNVALNVLLEHKADETSDFERNIAANLETLVFPHLAKLRISRNADEIADLSDIIRQNLEHLVSPFAYKLAMSRFHLTPTEIKVANLVAQDKTTKEIADLLHISPKSVSHHRSHIRKKLGLTHTPFSLKTHLTTFLNTRP